MPNEKSKLVWSSEKDGDLRAKVMKAPLIKNSLPPGQQVAYLHKESKGRGGKGVSLIKNLVLTEADMKDLLKHLKQVCGSGGTVKDGLIEIQGDQREKIAAALKKLGYGVKLAGG